MAFSAAVRHPYRLFFLAGVVFGLWGAGLKLFAALGGPTGPGTHSQLMVGGFLIGFTAGFLVTAIPRMTGSRPLVRWEALGLLVALVVHPALCAVGLAVFTLNRGLTGSARLTGTLMAVPIALGLGAMGSVLYGGQGSVLFEQAMLTLLIIGVGGRLVVNLLGWGPPRVWPLFPLFLGLLTGAYILEDVAIHSGQNFLLALQVCRLALTTFLFMKIWRLYRWPAVASRQALGLWFTLWAILAGQWLWALVPGWGVGALHLVFVAGFSLMIVIVATRVSLAHGGYSLEPEAKSPWLLGSGLAVIVAAMIRSSFEWFPEHGAVLLAVSSGLWILALMIWSLQVLPKTLGFVTPDDSDADCARPVVRS